MKSFSRSIFSLFFLFFILNNDLVITVQAYKNERSLLNALAGSKKGEKSSSHHFRESNSRALKSSSVLTSNSWNSRLQGEYVRNRARIFPLLIAVIVIVAITIVVATIKKVYDKQLEKEKKFLTNIANKHKVEIKNDRLKSNMDFIDYCLGFQKISGLYEAYAIAAKIKNEELQLSYKGLQAALTAKETATDPLAVILGPIAQKYVKFFGTKIDPQRITKEIDDQTASLAETTNKFCFNSFEIRAKTSKKTVLGDIYQGFSEGEYQTIDASMISNKRFWKEAAIAAGTGASSLFEVAVEEKFGTDAIKDVTDAGKSLEEYEKVDSFKLIDVPEDIEFNIFSAVNFAGSSVSTLIQLKGQLKELQEIGEETKEDEKWKTFRKILKYVATGFEMMNNIVKSVFSGIETFTGGIKLNFPFLSIVAALAKFTDATINLVKFRRENLKLKTDKVEGLALDLQAEHSFLFWDMVDGGMSLLSESVEFILIMLGTATAGVTLIINAAVKLFVTVIQTIAAAMKLKKLRALKQKMIDMMNSQLKDFKTESEANHQRVSIERCAQLSSIFKNLIDGELEEFQQMIIGKQTFFDTFKAEIDSTEGKSLISEKNKRIVDLVCTESPASCFDFLESLEIDKTFINTDTVLQAKLKQIGKSQSVGSITSIMSVYKGLVGQSRDIAAASSAEEITYTLTLSSKLVQYGYTPIFFSPRYDIYACRGCGSQKNQLSDVQGFLQSSVVMEKFTELKKTFPNVKFQDTFQFVDAEVKKETDEISEYFVGVFNTDPVDSTKLQELVLTSNLVTKKWWTKRVPSNFELPMILTQKTNIYDTHKELIIFCIAMQNLNDVSENLKKEANLNILTTIIYKKKQKSDNPAHFFYLAMAPANYNSASMCTVNKKVLDTKYCQFDKMEYPAEMANFVYKYSLYIQDDYPDFPPNLFTDNGWEIAKTKVFEISAVKEKVTLNLLVKKVMQVSGFVVPNPAPTVVDIMKLMETKKNEIFKKMVEFIKPILCSDECKAMAPTVSRRSTTKEGVIRIANICTISADFWNFKIADLMSYTTEAIGCTSKFACPAGEDFWTNKAGIVTDLKAQKFKCPSTKSACPEPPSNLTVDKTKLKATGKTTSGTTATAKVTTPATTATTGAGVKKKHH